jgi:hypothetical protein
VGVDRIEQGDGAPRLTRTMSSRKLLAHDFIKRYFASWGQSPTLGELAAELGVSNKRAYDLVHQLADERMLEVTAGKTRGIRLIDRTEELSEADVLVRLARSGWTIAAGGNVLQPPVVELDHVADALVATLTEKGLPPLVDLDHDPDEATGAGKHGENKGRAGARSAAPARRAAGRDQDRLGKASP